MDFAGFQDNTGQTCEFHEKERGCKDGKVNKGKISEEELKSFANSDGVSPLDACCACGGGRITTGKPKTIKKFANCTGFLHLSKP